MKLADALKPGAIAYIFVTPKTRPDLIDHMQRGGLTRTMPDLTTKSAEMCISGNGPVAVEVDGHIVSGLFSEGHWPRCTCEDYREARHGYMYGDPSLPRPCHHIEQAKANICGWHSEYSSDPQDKPGVCPWCDGPTIPVLVAG